MVGEGGFEGVACVVENEAEAGLEKQVVEAALGRVQFLKLLVFPVRVVLGGLVEPSGKPACHGCQRNHREDSKLETHSIDEEGEQRTAYLYGIASDCPFIHGGLQERWSASKPSTVHGQICRQIESLANHCAL